MNTDPTTNQQSVWRDPNANFLESDKGSDNDEALMTKPERMPKSECLVGGNSLEYAYPGFGHSGFFRHSSFVIRHSHRSFSLIELVCVLAVIGILAGMLVPALIRQLDKIAGDQESAALKSFSDALQQSIMRNRYIASYDTWASTVSIELGVDASNVSTNARRQPRVFLIDPALRIGDNTTNRLPYTQANWLTQTRSGSGVTNSAGALVPPLSPRLVMLSSIARALPAGVVSGVPAAADFNGIWDSADGTVPSAPAFAGWAGSGDDLKIQRINLSPLFVRLVLTTNVSESAYYSIDSTNSADLYNVPSPGRDGYFIRNSVLYLYTHGRTIIDSQQILTRDTSFVYDQNVWRSSLTGGSFLAGSLDLGSIVDKYLDAPENTNALYTIAKSNITQQAVVVSNMIAYMTAYTNWAASNFQDAARKTTARNVEGNLQTAVLDQYQSGNPDHLPHPTACPP